MKSRLQRGLGARGTSDAMEEVRYRRGLRTGSRYGADACPTRGGARRGVCYNPRISIGRYPALQRNTPLPTPPCINTTDPVL